MREKALELIAIVWPSNENFIRSIVDSTTAQLKETPEGLTPERAKAVSDLEINLRANEKIREDQLVAEITKILDEKELDDLIAFYRTPLATKAAGIGDALNVVENRLLQAVGGATPSFQEMMNDIAKAFMVANTEGEVAASIAANPVGMDSPLPEAPPPPEAA